jgi:hypothetical protein
MSERERGKRKSALMNSNATVSVLASPAPAYCPRGRGERKSALINSNACQTRPYQIRASWCTCTSSSTAAATRQAHVEQQHGPHAQAHQRYMQSTPQAQISHQQNRDGSHGTGQFTGLAKNRLVQPVLLVRLHRWSFK